MPDKMRCFIALDLPENIVSELVKLQEELKQQNLFIGKSTEKENLHLTLKFLGSIPLDRINEVKKRLRQISLKQFTAEIDEIGIFSEEFVRIIWVKLNGKEVFELQESVDNALVDFFPKEERFMSHITIARVKNIKEKQPLFDALKKIKINIKGKINSFSLISSTLAPSGAIYETIERYKLD